MRLLRILFRLLYNELAFTYDFVAWASSIGQWRAWQRTALPELMGGRVLEIAHGTGDMLLDLLALGRAPVGLDLSRTMGRIARRKLNQNGLDAPLVRASVAALPFPTASFPSLLSTFPAEFFFEPQSAREFYRVLQPGGRLVGVLNAVILPHGALDRLGYWLYRLTGQSADALPGRVLDPFRAAGFHVSVKTVTLPRSVVHIIIAEKMSR